MVEGGTLVKIREIEIGWLAWFGSSVFEVILLDGWAVLVAKRNGPRRSFGAV